MITLKAVKADRYIESFHAARVKMFWARAGVGPGIHHVTVARSLRLGLGPSLALIIKDRC